MHSNPYSMCDSLKAEAVGKQYEAEEAMWDLECLVEVYCWLNDEVIWWPQGKAHPKTHLSWKIRLSEIFGVSEICFFS